MTKNEVKKLANECGYEAVYSGKEGQFIFEHIEGTHNVNIDPEKLKQLSKIMLKHQQK